MPYAATHILAAILLAELFRHYVIKNNKIFPRYYILIAAIGGILPDFDFGIFYTLSLFGFGFSIEEIHRTFLHTLFVPLLLFIIGFIAMIFNVKLKEISKHHLKIPIVFYILAIGSLLHLILDATFFGEITPFYPFSSFSVGLNILYTLPLSWRGSFLPALDGVLLVLWILWLEFKLKISNYF
ncbi:metal-dependent hydrolase [Candidatus Pacearchaeota archaeon]|nr:metal-dependent hydrolase [Candidatus Pacearchaeota archaeon]